MFTRNIMNNRKFPFSPSVTVFDLQCVRIDIQKRSKASKWMLLLLKNYASLHLPPLAGTSPSLPYTCLFIFSFFPSPTIPRVCCGPESCSWSSANLERSSAFLEIWEGRRHEIGCKIHKLFICTTNIFSLSWFITLQHTPYSWLFVSYVTRLN